jgi:isoleucyl-tRNA synthetase
MRNLALPELEKARQAKTIGKSLDAKVLVSGASPAIAEAKNHREILRELLNVSQLEFTTEPATDDVFAVNKADGQKCERCWHWETDINPNHPEHPTICARCITAVKENLQT